MVDKEDGITTAATMVKAKAAMSIPRRQLRRPNQAKTLPSLNYLPLPNEA
jgi:hypothetical protein